VPAAEATGTAEKAVEPTAENAVDGGGINSPRFRFAAARFAAPLCCLRCCLRPLRSCWRPLRSRVSRRLPASALEGAPGPGTTNPVDSMGVGGGAPCM